MKSDEEMIASLLKKRRIIVIGQEKRRKHILISFLSIAVVCVGIIAAVKLIHNSTVTNPVVPSVTEPATEPTAQTDDTVVINEIEPIVDLDFSSTFWIWVDERNKEVQSMTYDEICDYFGIQDIDLSVIDEGYEFNKYGSGIAFKGSAFGTWEGEQGAFLDENHFIYNYGDGSADIIMDKNSSYHSGDYYVKSDITTIEPDELDSRINDINVKLYHYTSTEKQSCYVAKLMLSDTAITVNTYDLTEQQLVDIVRYVTTLKDNAEVITFNKIVPIPDDYGFKSFPDYVKNDVEKFAQWMTKEEICSYYGIKPVDLSAVDKSYIFDTDKSGLSPEYGFAVCKNEDTFWLDENYFTYNCGETGTVQIIIDKDSRNGDYWLTSSLETIEAGTGNSQINGQGVKLYSYTSDNGIACYVARMDINGLEIIINSHNISESQFVDVVRYVTTL